MFISNKKVLSSLYIFLSLLFSNVSFAHAEKGKGFVLIPGKELWESNMRKFGKLTCDSLFDPAKNVSQLLDETYYDGAYVFFQIGDYLKDPYWYTCAKRAIHIYRDLYSLPAGAQVPGYWNFTLGFLEDFLRNGDFLSKFAAIAQSLFAAFAPDTTPLSYTKSAEDSREVAYTILSYLTAEKLGVSRRTRLKSLVNQGIGHLRAWRLGRAEYVRPFMVGLTMQSLISYDQVNPDRRVRSEVFKMLSWLWRRTWNRRAESFSYTDRVTETGGTNPAPDLNLLIAPAFAWAYHLTGKQVFRERGDQVFLGGVKNAWLNRGKQFNQNYLWSFRYIKFREMAVASG
jgi:hypothetical protein